MSLDVFFGRPYQREDFPCARLALDVWRHLTGRDVAASVAGFLVPGRDRGRLGHVDGVTVLERPADPCFVLMRSRLRDLHVGVFHRGKIIHFADNRRVEFQPPEVVTAGFSKVRYFTC